MAALLYSMYVNIDMEENAAWKFSKEHDRLHKPDSSGTFTVFSSDYRSVLPGKAKLRYLSQ